MSRSANELFEVSVDQVRRGDLRTALRTLLEAVAADPAHDDALTSAARIARMLGSEHDARLFDAILEHPNDPEPLYQLGFQLVDQGRADLGLPVLERCLELDPARLSTRREIAYARLMLRDFGAAERLMLALADEPDLADAEQLDALLMAVEAALYGGDRRRATAHLTRADELVPNDEQRHRLDALGALLGRAARFDDLASLDLRGWHLVQHAGVILKVAGGPFEDGSRSGRYDVLRLRHDMVAFLLQRLLHLLERLDLVPDSFIPAGEVAAPLVDALASRADRRVADTIAPGDGPRAMLVASNVDELAPFTSLIADHSPDVQVFSLNLDWTRDALVCPEVVGVLARRVMLPWEEAVTLETGTRRMRREPGDERPAEQIGADLARLMDGLPDDGGAARREFEERYLPHRDLLLLGNEELYPQRRRFTQLSPCWTDEDDEARDAD